MEKTGDQPTAPPSSSTNGLLGRLKTAWKFKSVKILVLVLFPLGLYVADVISDLWLAAQYYNNGDLYWFGWTIGLVLGPSLIININISHTFFPMDADNKITYYVRKYLLPFLQLCVLMEYFDILCQLLRGKNVPVRISKGDSLPYAHLLEAMLESIPQLCLQLYIIISTGEQVSVLKVITIVTSLLAAVKAVVTFLYLMNMKGTYRTFSCGCVTNVILLTVWKVVEISARVLAVGLFASAFKQWITVHIGVHWLIMTVAYMWIDDGNNNRRRRFMIQKPLHMAVDTFSMTFSVKHQRTFWLNTMLTWLGNITMVTMWYALQTGQDWYDIPAMVGVPVASVVSAGFGFIIMKRSVLKFRFKHVYRHDITKFFEKSG